MQLLRFFVIPQSLAKRRLASGTSTLSCVQADANGTFEQHFKLSFAAKLIYRGNPAKGYPTLRKFDTPNQTTKAVFGAHRPRPPQTPAASF
jgi:hypothetical protein